MPDAFKAWTLERVTTLPYYLFQIYSTQSLAQTHLKNFDDAIIQLEIQPGQETGIWTFTYHDQLIPRAIAQCGINSKLHYDPTLDMGNCGAFESACSYLVHLARYSHWSNPSGFPLVPIPLTPNQLAVILDYHQNLFSYNQDGRRRQTGKRIKEDIGQVLEVVGIRFVEIQLSTL